MKKKLIALITALTLCAAVVVGGTLAYFSLQTEEVTNVFTYNKDDEPGGEIVEQTWPDAPVNPGQHVPKDPLVRMTAGNPAEPYYVAMEISGATKADTRINNLKDILDSGIATIVGFDTVSFDYEQDTTTGNIYAYYKDTLYYAEDAQGNPDYTKTDSKPAFTAVKMAGQTELEAWMGSSKELDFSINVKGYIVGAINDTKFKDGFDSTQYPDDHEFTREELYDLFPSCKAAMQDAFPTVFHSGLTTFTPPVTP